MDAQALVGIVERLVERAQSGPLADQRRVVTNLRYILENLELMHQRHSSVREDARQEEQRQGFMLAVSLLYGGLEELEHGLLDGDMQRLHGARERVREAAGQMSHLQAQLEDGVELSSETL